jgi:hypothetical protein
MKRKIEVDSNKWRMRAGHNSVPREVQEFEPEALVEVGWRADPCAGIVQLGIVLFRQHIPINPPVEL